MITKIPPFTLGWELEATSAASGEIVGLEAGTDGSVNGDALEYKTMRESVNDPLVSLRILRQLCASKTLEVDRSCGFHVHIGLGTRSRRIHQWAAWFVTLARCVEESAFGAVPMSRRENHYCRKWRIFDQASVIEQAYAASKHHNPSRYNWVNPVEIFREGGIRTIEIRLMGHSRSYPYLLSWVSACQLMAASAWRLVFDPSRLHHEQGLLSSVFHRIQEVFQGQATTRRRASLAQELHRHAMLELRPAGAERPFLELERNFLEIGARDQEENQAMSLMRSDIRRTTQRNRDIDSNHTRGRRYYAGDTVRYIRPQTDSLDGQLTLNGLYRVTEYAQGAHVTVFNNYLEPWTIDLQNVRLESRHFQSVHAFTERSHDIAEPVF